MPTDFEELSGDIHQEIISHLDIIDSVSLIQSCKCYYSNRSLWFGALSNARNMFPLPGPPWQELQYFPDLKPMAVHAARLLRTWSKDVSRCHSVTKKKVWVGDRIILVIPGTHIVVTALGTGKANRISCWDLSQAPRLIGSVDDVLKDKISQPFMTAGRSTYAIISKTLSECVSGSATLIVISVDYSDLAAPVFTMVHRKKIISSPVTILPAMDSHTTGVLVGENLTRLPPTVTAFQIDFVKFDTTSNCDSLSLTETRELKLSSPGFWEGPHGRPKLHLVWIAGQTLNLTFHMNAIFHWRMSLSDATAVPKVIRPGLPIHTLCDPQISGVRGFSHEIRRSGTTVSDREWRCVLSFWVSDSKYHQFNFVSGQKRLWPKARAVNVSGTSVVVLYGDGPDELEQIQTLVLYRLWAPTRCTRHVLEIPGVGLRRIEEKGMFLDDHLGIIHLQDTGGTIFSCSFT
ncbi:hypothetical protein C8J56DRAFT_1104890 [Mycena floridula]|nr:hypothetical protein C8J56DRAFT_1104890 [Mycena floridula]